MGVENPPVMPSPLITRLSFSQTAVKQPSETVPDVLSKINRAQPEPIQRIKPKPVAAERAPVLEKIEKTEAVKKITSQPQTQGQQVRISSEKILQQQREQYLEKLLSHIESFKFYPRAARRRSIEGNVMISFILDDSGNYQQLILDGQRSVLVNATRMALEAAIPLPVPADHLALSRKIKFTMLYSLSE